MASLATGVTDRGLTSWHLAQEVITASRALAVFMGIGAWFARVVTLSLMTFLALLAI